MARPRTIAHFRTVRCFVCTECRDDSPNIYYNHFLYCTGIDNKLIRLYIFKDTIIFQHYIVSLLEQWKPTETVSRILYIIFPYIPCVCGTDVLLKYIQRGHFTNWNITIISFNRPHACESNFSRRLKVGTYV